MQCAFSRRVNNKCSQQYCGGSIAPLGIGGGSIGAVPILLGNHNTGFPIRNWPNREFPNRAAPIRKFPIRSIPIRQFPIRNLPGAWLVGVPLMRWSNCDRLNAIHAFSYALPPADRMGANSAKRIHSLIAGCPFGCHPIELTYLPFLHFYYY